jgi:hypothetical protein
MLDSVNGLVPKDPDQSGNPILRDSKERNLRNAVKFEF